MLSANDAVDPFAGLTIGSGALPEVKLRLERRLGEGGTAVAYLATRFGPEGTSPVVVKRDLPGLAREARLAPNIVVAFATKISEQSRGLHRVA